MLGLGKPWLIYLEGMEECYLLEPLVIRGLSHSVNLGITFLQKNRLKLSCTEEGVVLTPVKEGSNSRARLVDGGCVSFKNRRSGKISRATKEQEISAQTWRIPREKMNVNVLQGEIKENIGIYAKEKCSIPAGMGKYVPIQTNKEIQGDVLIETSDNTVPGLILPEIVYNVKRKIGSIFIENHNSVSLDLQRGQTIGMVSSCVVT